SCGSGFRRPTPFATMPRSERGRKRVITRSDPTGPGGEARGFRSGKKALIVGLASNRSIAWGIAQAMHREGAELAFSYQNEKLQSRVEEFAAELGSRLTFRMDVGVDEEIEGA